MNVRTRIRNLETAEKALREKLTRSQADDPVTVAAIVRSTIEDSEFSKACLDVAALDVWLHDRLEAHIAKVTGRPAPPHGIGPDPAPRPIPTIPKVQREETNDSTAAT